MKIAIIGSRGLWIDDLSLYIANGVTEIISGGANGIDSCAAEYARKKGIKLTVFLPDYKRYKRGAPLVRNREIIEAADRSLHLGTVNQRGQSILLSLARR